MKWYIQYFYNYEKNIWIIIHSILKQNESKEMSRRAYDVMSRQGADRDGLACYSRSGESDVGGQGSIMDSAYETNSIKTLSETETDTVDETRNWQI